MIYHDFTLNDFKRFHRGMGVGRLEVRVCGIETIEIIPYQQGGPSVDAGGLRRRHNTETR